MADADGKRAQILSTVERLAEWVFTQHLDLLAQAEAQLRALRHRIGRVERLRAAKQRLGAEPSDDERFAVVTGLLDEIARLDEQLILERHCCGEMQKTVSEMHQRLEGLRDLPG